MAFLLFTEKHVKDASNDKKYALFPRISGAKHVQHIQKVKEYFLNYRCQMNKKLYFTSTFSFTEIERMDIVTDLNNKLVTSDNNDHNYH